MGGKGGSEGRKFWGDTRQCWGRSLPRLLSGISLVVRTSQPASPLPSASGGFSLVLILTRPQPSRRSFYLLSFLKILRCITHTNLMVGLRTERHLYPAAEGKAWNGVSSLETSERSSPVNASVNQRGLEFCARPSHELFL